MKKFFNPVLVVHRDEKKSGHLTSMTGILFCALAFLICVLLSITPLNRLTGTAELVALPTNSLLLAIGSWLPWNLSLTSNLHASQMSSHIVLFLLLVALEFVFYGLGAYWIQRNSVSSNYLRTLKVIWLTTLIVGLVFILTPAMLSHDVYVYAGYGRLLVVHQANPYFVTLSAYPHDPFIHLDNWSNAPAAYGPLWLVVSALGSLFAGDHPLLYVLLYRTIGLIAHFLNSVLISAILKRASKSQRVTAVGTLLYAWNPLVLQESSLGGHMDVWMVTLMLLGIFFCLRAEQLPNQQFPPLHRYLPPLIAFTLATLIKFTAAPLVVFFLILFTRKVLWSSPLSFRMLQILHWRLAMVSFVLAALIAMGIAFIFYFPFWLGHPISMIIASFTTPPSANQSYGSILEAILKWTGSHKGSAPGWITTVLHPFSLYKTWQSIDAFALVLGLLVGAIGLWCVPTTRTLIIVTLGVLGMLLIVTPWFFPWYITWIVGLAAVCLPVIHERVSRALVAFTLVFSVSAHCIYLFAYGYAPFGIWTGLACLTTVVPPLFAFLFSFLFPVPLRHEIPQSLTKTVSEETSSFGTL